MSPNTIVLAKLLGPIFVFAGLGIAVNKKLMKKIVEDFGKNYGMLYFMGMFTMIVGMIMVITHTIWTSIPAGIITVFGWMAAIKGALLMVIPDHLMKLSKKMSKTTDLYVLIGIIWVGLGIYIGYVGYFM